MVNLRQKVISHHALDQLTRQVNDECKRGWQLLNGPTSVPVEVPGAELNIFAIFMGPLLPVSIPYLKTGYTTTLQVDVDQWREQQIFNINAHEAQFLATRLQNFTGHNCSETIRALWDRMQYAGLHTVNDLYQVLPVKPAKAKMNAAPLVSVLQEYAAHLSDNIKGVKRRTDTVMHTMQGWLNDLERFNVVVRDRLARYNEQRAIARTQDP